MKTKHFLLGGMAAAALLSSCGKDDNTYTMNGSVAADSLNGKSIYLQSFTTDSILDSLEVQNGAFKLEGKVDTAEIQLYAFKGLPYKVKAIPEAGTITIDTAGYATGTPMNDELTAMLKKRAEIIDEMSKKIAEAEKAKSPKIDSLVDAYEQEAMRQMRPVVDEVFAKHPDDALTYFCVHEYIGLAQEYSELIPVFDKVGEKVKRIPRIASFIETLDLLRNTVVGKKFIDFESTDWNNKPVKMSDYIGKGKFVLADFWASWCGPCRHELPYVANAYKKYTDKGLTVIGVDVKDTKEGYDKIRKTMGVEWNQIRDDQWEHAKKYGIMGIPEIILFGPDGTILARGLRGDGIEAAIKKHMNL